MNPYHSVNRGGGKKVNWYMLGDFDEETLWLHFACLEKVGAGKHFFTPANAHRSTQNAVKHFPIAGIQ